MITPLPDELRYLDSALRELAKLPPEELDEDVDISKLEEALRERIRSMNIRDAQQRLNGDRVALENWLRSSGNSEGHVVWVIAFLGSRPGALVRHLLSPHQNDNDPKIDFEPPSGWTAKPFSSNIQLFKGRKDVGGIWAIEPSDLASCLRQNEIRDEIESRNRNPFSRMIWRKSGVRLGECHGWKFVSIQPAPTSWKSVQYLLEVPGGAVDIKLDVNDDGFR